MLQPYQSYRGDTERGSGRIIVLNCESIPQRNAAKRVMLPVCARSRSNSPCKWSVVSLDDTSSSAAARNATVSFASCLSNRSCRSPSRVSSVECSRITRTNASTAIRHPSRASGKVILIRLSLRSMKANC